MNTTGAGVNIKLSTLHPLTAESKRGFCNEEQGSKTLCNMQRKNTRHCH